MHGINTMSTEPSIHQRRCWRLWWLQASVSHVWVAQLISIIWMEKKKEWKKLNKTGDFLVIYDFFFAFLKKKKMLCSSASYLTKDTSSLAHHI